MSQQQKVVLLAGASVALVVAVGFFLYLRKRSQEEEYENDQEGKEELEFADLNAREESVASAGQSIVKVQVPQHVVGTIIGREGSNIKQLRAEFGVRLNFDREESLNKEKINEDTKKQDRLLEIRGQREKVRDAEQKILGIIAETPKDVETEILVPTGSCGRIIGKGGQNIREMCSISGAKIIVDRNQLHSLDNQRKVSISGTTVQVEYAKLLIKEKVEQAKADAYKYGRDGEFKVKNFYNFPHVTLPTTGEYFQVFVSSCRSPHHFWVQLVSKESTKLDMMTNDMSEVYSQLKSDEERLETGNIGDLCVAPYLEDGDWYRAAISKINQDRTADVFYLDYGDTGSVNIDEIKTIRPKFKEIYAQAVLCKLPIKPSGDAWSEDAKQEFQNLTYCAQWKPIMSKVIQLERTEDNIVPILQLVDTSQDEDADVANILVQKGFATIVEPVSNDTVTDGRIKNDIALLAEKGLIDEDPISAVNENTQDLESFPREVDHDNEFIPEVPDVSRVYENEAESKIVTEEAVIAVEEQVQEHELGLNDIPFGDEVDSTVLLATESILKELNNHSREEEHFALISESEFQEIDTKEVESENELQDNFRTPTIEQEQSSDDPFHTSPDVSRGDSNKSNLNSGVEVHTVSSKVIQNTSPDKIEIKIAESVFSQEEITEVECENPSVDIFEPFEDNSKCLDGESIISLSSSFERDAVESVNDMKSTALPEVQSEPEFITSIEDRLCTSKDDDSSNADDSCDSGVKCELNDQNLDSGSYEASLVEDENEVKAEEPVNTCSSTNEEQTLSSDSNVHKGKLINSGNIIYEKIVPSPKRSPSKDFDDEESLQSKTDDELDAKVVNGSFPCDIVCESEVGVVPSLEKDPPAIKVVAEKMSLSTDDLLKNNEIILNKVDSHLRSTIQRQGQALDTKPLDLKTSTPSDNKTIHKDSELSVFDRNNELEKTNCITKAKSEPQISVEKTSKFTRSDSDDYVDIDIKTVGGSLVAYVSDQNLDSAGQAVQANRNKSDTSIEDELQRSLEETSRKNVHKNSMEMARENLLTIRNSHESDDESYFSAQSDVTLTSIQSEEGLNYYTAESDNLSFFTADSRAMSPSSDSFFSIPSPRGSKLSMISIESSEPRLSGSFSNFEVNFDEKAGLFKSNESILSSERKSNPNVDEVGKETTI